MVRKHGIRDLQRLVASVSLLRASEAGRLWRRGEMLRSYRDLIKDRKPKMSEATGTEGRHATLPRLSFMFNLEWEGLNNPYFNAR